MNRLKSQTRPPASVFIFAPIIAAIIGAGGGVWHADIKFRQTQVNREIDAIEHRVEQYQLEIRTTQMRNDAILNRFAIRKQLEESGSPLRPIPIGLFEEVKPAPPAAVASALP
ncbi:MAG: hypothetical protein WCO57_11260 [Verrucomicrobiota bacterium]